MEWSSRFFTEVVRTMAFKKLPSASLKVKPSMLTWLSLNLSTNQKRKSIRSSHLHGRFLQTSTSTLKHSGAVVQPGSQFGEFGGLFLCVSTLDQSDTSEKATIAGELPKNYRRKIGFQQSTIAGWWVRQTHGLPAHPMTMEEISWTWKRNYNLAWILSRAIH